MAREIILFAQETAFMVPNASPVVWPAANANVFYGRLSEGNSFTMRPTIVPVTVPYGGGFNIPAFTVSDKYVCKGKYTTKLYASDFSKFLLQWGMQQVNSGHCVAGAGVTAGTGIWGSTESPGNTASVSILHAIQRPQDGSFKCHHYTGVKVDSIDFTISQESQIATLTMNLTGAVAHGNPFDGTVDPTISGTPGTAPTWNVGSTATIWSPPGTGNLQTTPFMFVHSGYQAGVGSLAAGTAVLTGTQVSSITSTTAGSGYVLPPLVVFTGGGGSGAAAIAVLSGTGVGSYIITSPGNGYTSAPIVTIYPVPAAGLLVGSNRTTFESVKFTCTNNMVTRFWANRFAQFAQWCGRTTQLTVSNFYQPTSSAPDDRLSYEAIAAQPVSFVMNNGQHSAGFVMNNNNIFVGFDDNLPLADIYTQSMTITSQFDPNYAVTDSNLAADMQLIFT